MSKSKNKIIRYSNLLKKVSNWKSYLWFKVFSRKENFEFILRNSISITVPRKILSSFRECFFDEIYIRHFPKNLLDKKNMVVLDIGANAGYFSLFAHSSFNSPSIYAFEPMPYAYKVLNQYRDTYKEMNLHTYQEAVSNENGKLVLNSDTIDGYTTEASIFADDNKKHQFEVKAVNLQTFMQDEKLEAIDLLKLDCEGSEYAILYDLPKEILGKISLLCIETHKGNNANENIESLAEYLLSNQFELVTLSEGYTGYIWAWKK